MHLDQPTAAVACSSSRGGERAVYLHLGAAPAAMRARELCHSAVLEILRPYDQPERLREALCAELGPRRRTSVPPALAAPTAFVVPPARQLAAAAAAAPPSTVGGS